MCWDDSHHLCAFNTGHRRPLKTNQEKPHCGTKALLFDIAVQDTTACAVSGPPMLTCQACQKCYWV